MSNMGIEWDVAEVLEYDYTYQYVAPNQISSNVDKLFALKVRSVSGYFNNNILIVKPSNINLKQIPLVGEFVLIYKTFNEQATSTKWREAWYYVTSIDVQSSINENMLPGLSDGLTQEEIDKIVPGKTFQRKSVAPLQPYEGDYILEGRTGNSIRFGSSINTTYPAGYYYEAPSWVSPSSNNDGDPIIILSNGRHTTRNKEFIVENIEWDASSLYLTSTQVIDNLSLSKDLTIHAYSFVGSQLIGNADRIVLRAKKDIAVIDSEMAIVLNTPGEIYIGGEDASENLVHGNVLETILQNILNQLKVSIQCGTNLGTFLDTSAIDNAQAAMIELKNSKYFITKNTNKL